MSRKKRENHETTPGEGHESEPFLLRWARRKAGGAEYADPRELEQYEPVEQQKSEASGAESQAPDATDSDGAMAPGDAALGQPMDDEDKGDDDMPSLDSIDEGGTVADFFSPGVSQGLRRAALRRLFAQSALPVGDDLDDYAGDYTKYTKLGDLATNAMRHRLELARKRLLERNPESAQDQLAVDDGPSQTAASTADAEDDPDTKPMNTEDGRDTNNATARVDAEKSVDSPDERLPEESSANDRNPR